jgi:glutamate/tyrosine decarboxylase-like PLP-dependent enzyme
MVSLGREGYMNYARGIFEASFAMQDAVRSHDALQVIGDPSFCFSFTSDELDIYHVNDFLKTRGWRLNGQQYPDAIHMAVTRPQAQPGVVEKFATDLADAVDYAASGPEDPPASGAIYGGVAGGLTEEADSFIRAIMADMMDKQQGLPH